MVSKANHFRSPTRASKKLRLAENPDCRSLADRISIASAKDTVEKGKTDRTDSAQRAGEQINNVEALLSRFEHSQRTGKRT
ncbi:hypothetical protein PTTG_27762 [Puccinia triticina 1-1 BBBD Race 1]|uniref:Uncharacterized protein n=1 Tax=Puccinia triticina (isolate 1-1 / race 1 (BBBD)) TaxID=630390 RepID=A0A180GHZ1_PUCT1|nr:hypothetical protein PTTG_27762 [Puccinia triticina 1-1 BBBD Race 1]